MRYLFESKNLIGDALYVGPALRAWLKKAGADSLSDEIFMYTLNDHVAPLYQGMVRDMVNLKIVHERPAGEFKFEHVFNVSDVLSADGQTVTAPGAFQLSDRKRQHIATSYAELLGVTIDTVKPTYIPDNYGTSDEASFIRSVHGCILVSMFSASCASRANPPQPPNKMLPWPKWKPILKLIRETYPDAPIRFLGAPTDRIPSDLIFHVEPGEQMFGIPMNRLALIMKKAKLLITVDNGMGHLAATQECPTWLMYPRCLGTHYIVPIGNPNLLKSWRQIDPVYVSPTQLTMALRYAFKELEELKR